MGRYHPLLVALHWLSAAMIILTLVSGGIAPLGFHLASGGLILMVFLLRVATKLKARVPPLEGPQAQIARVVHLSLYLLVFGVITSGIGLVIDANLLQVIQGNATLPADFSESAAYATHSLFTDLLLAAIAAHVIAAGWHQFVRRDRIFSRMWFRKSGQLEF
ncbi:MAG: cytochrome b/b6 domain-containing protein [Roseibium sp.]|uniref:cytochrome b n=1 Tax=Roseibium sp. TaxID=1936156 RepID=UPI0026044912|nr:cytochrome b/b6 domain-containing protein [Roseibium sp.]MCV0425528.1 cytochrome b/b6 domain-containing protein [Roseibium sp.]